MSDPTNPKDALGVKKVPLSLVPPSSIIYQALAMDDGAEKYGPYNFRETPVRYTVYADACDRHMKRVFDGEWLDPDSGKPNLGHALACIGIIVDAYETGNLIDDRPKPGTTPALLEKWRKK